MIESGTDWLGAEYKRTDHDFSASSEWTITKVSMTKDCRTLVITVEKGEEDGC